MINRLWAVNVNEQHQQQQQQWPRFQLAMLAPADYRQHLALHYPPTLTSTTSTRPSYRNCGYNLAGKVLPRHQQQHQHRAQPYTLSKPVTTQPPRAEQEKKQTSFTTTMSRLLAIASTFVKSLFAWSNSQQSKQQQQQQQGGNNSSSSSRSSEPTKFKLSIFRGSSNSSRSSRVDKWTCFVCMSKHTLDVVACTICGSLQTTTRNNQQQYTLPQPQPQPPPTTTITTATALSGVSSGSSKTWTCVVCYYANDCCKVVCINCFSSKLTKRNSNDIDKENNGWHFKRSRPSLQPPAPSSASLSTNAIVSISGGIAMRTPLASSGKHQTNNVLVTPLRPHDGLDRFDFDAAKCIDDLHHLKIVRTASTSTAVSVAAPAITSNVSAVDIPRLAQVHQPPPQPHQTQQPQPKNQCPNHYRCGSKGHVDEYRHKSHRCVKNCPKRQ